MGEGIREMTDADFEKVLAGTDKLVIVEFYTTTCPNCRAIEPVYRQLSEELEREAVFGKMNAQTSPATAGRHGILGVPTFKFFCKGEPIGELVGAVNATMLRNTIKDLIRHRAECVGRSTRISYEMDGYG